MNTFYQRNEVKISKIALIFIFIGLIRTLGEGAYKLDAGITPTLPEFKLYIIGSLFTSACCLLMTILFFYRKYTILTITAVITLIIMIWIKTVYIA